MFKRSNDSWSLPNCFKRATCAYNAFENGSSQSERAASSPESFARKRINLSREDYSVIFYFETFPFFTLCIWLRIAFFNFSFTFPWNVTHDWNTKYVNRERFKREIVGGLISSTLDDFPIYWKLRTSNFFRDWRN